MKVLADLHHGQLWESLRLLFEVRFGYELFRPIGTEWHTEGFWAVYNHPATVQQFLGIGAAEPTDVHGVPVSLTHGDSAWINKEADRLPAEDGLYRVGKQRAITLDAFKRTKFDIVISSMPEHFPRFEKLIREYHPGARHIFQQGNNWPVPSGVVNHLNSTTVPSPAGSNSVYYHPEFDASEFYPGPCSNPRSIVNLMHYQQPTYQTEFYELKALLAPTGWTFHNHGAGNSDGAVSDVGQTLRDHGFLYHNKAGGEGYGFNIHTAVSTGRPVICHRSLYKGMTADAVLAGPGCSMNMDGISLKMLATRLEAAACRHDQLAAAVVSHFQKVVDFTAEFSAIRTFIRNLK